MTYGDDLSSEVGRILFDVEGQISALSNVIARIDRAMRHLNGLETHNAGVLGSINLLCGAKEDIEYTLRTKYQVIHQTLDEYRRAV